MENVAANAPLDLPPNVINMTLQRMSLSERFTCALVCKAWAQEAAAATHSIILRHEVQDLSCLQRWLAKDGAQVEVLQLHACRGAAVLTALPCPQLQDLLLGGRCSLDSRVWNDIAAATKLTSVSLVDTSCQQADVVSALTALPDLEQLTWHDDRCVQQSPLTDSMLLQQLTKLTALKLGFIGAADALEHLGLLTRLQDLSLTVSDAWAAAGCPGLQELKALTRLDLLEAEIGIPASVSQLTTLQQLDVARATSTALNKLSALTGLTQLYVHHLDDLLPSSPPLQLPGLQQLGVCTGNGTMPMSFLACCKRLQVLDLCIVHLSGAGSLVASSMLQHLDLSFCRGSVADGAAAPFSWQQVFPRPMRLPHLKSLKMLDLEPVVQHADMECMVACCSSL